VSPSPLSESPEESPVLPEVSDPDGELEAVLLVFFPEVELESSSLEESSVLLEVFEPDPLSEQLTHLHLLRLSQTNLRPLPELSVPSEPLPDEESDVLLLSVDPVELLSSSEESLVLFEVSLPLPLELELVWSLVSLVLDVTSHDGLPPLLLLPRLPPPMAVVIVPPVLTAVLPDLSPVGVVSLVE
jgi:hypothetical protein